MKASKTRIGKVTLKAGGAALRVLHTERQEGHVADRLRDWFGEVMKGGPPPDAFGAVAVWAVPGTPGYFEHIVSWATGSDAIPATLVPKMLLSYLEQDVTNWRAENRIMRVLGYVPDDDSAS